MQSLRLDPISQPFTATITPSGSKSLTNRALILAALCDGECELSNVLFADDTRAMIEALQKLGFDLHIDELARTIAVTGLGGKIPATAADIFCGNSGTTIRFLAAMMSLGHGNFTLDGIARMRKRPIGQLVDLLKNLGTRIDYLGEENFPPVKIHARGLPGGIVRFGASQSSQYLSAVLLAAPYARNEVRVDLEPNQTSWPYVAMTMQLMDRFGITPELLRDKLTGEPKQIVIPRGTYSAKSYAIEPDASNATYFLAAAAINPGSKVTIENLGKSSLQGDVGFADVLHQMGAPLIFGKDFISTTGPEHLEAIDVDLSNMPDTAQTLGVVALFARGTTTIRGLHTLRVKETDRIAALSTELQKLGAEVEIEDNTLHITPPEKFRPAHIDTYDDHRMAMSFAVAGTREVGVTINDPMCVNKTYPKFFDDLRAMMKSLK